MVDIAWNTSLLRVSGKFFSGNFTCTCCCDCRDIATADSAGNALNSEWLIAQPFGLSEGGDDYDGCFTARGQISYDYLLAEILERLVDAKFISDDCRVKLILQKIGS